MKILLENHRDQSDQFDDVNQLKWSVWNDKIDISENRVVIFNTIFRNAVLLDVAEIKAPSEMDVSVSNTLFRLGILVPSNKDEKADWEKQYDNAKKDLSYLDLTILLTEDCQMRCVYCFEGTKKKNKITTSTLNDILSFLEDRSQECRILRVTWFGGEPLLAYDKLKEMSVAFIMFCRKHEIKYRADITTNGFALSKKRCNELINCLEVRRYIITVDGPENIHEQRRPLASMKPSFNVIWRNIEMLVDMGASVTMRMTIDKGNVEYIPALLDKIADSRLNGHIGLAFCRTIDYNYTPGNISELLYSDKEFADVEWQLIQYAHKLGLWRYDFPYAAPQGGCLRKGDIVIGTNGEIYKCLDTVGNTQWITGYIGENDWDENHRPAWYDVWRGWSPLNADTCSNCVLVPLCNGGCPHNALFADKRHGTFCSCPDWKANYRRQIKSLVAEIYDRKTL